MTALVDKVNFGGHSLVYLPRYLTKGDPLFQESNEAIRNKFMSSLRKLYPNLESDDIYASCISRVADFPVLSTLDFSENCLPPTSTSLRNVFIVNSAQIPNGTNNVNEIVRLASERVVDLISYMNRE